MDFYKVSGGGNDFIALPGVAQAPSPEQIRAWCRRGISLGADGLFLLNPRKSQAAAVTMEHYNADGGKASLCLNGTRCAAQLAFALGWAEGAVTIHTGAGTVRASSVEGEGNVIALALEPPRETPRPVSVTVEGTAYEGFFLTVGVPHFVLPWDTLETAPVDHLGAALVHHPALGEAGANINFVHQADPHQLELRTYERGVNAETLACGTGVLASAAVALHCGTGQLPLAAKTRGGFLLRVEEPWSLVGDARLVARGELLGGAVF